MQANPTHGPRTLTAVPQGTDIYRHRYSEADIAWLERQDLTDLEVIVALQEAYSQTDPEERHSVGFRRDTTPWRWGTVAELTQRLRDIEAALRLDPTDYYTRMKRLEAMIGLARHAKRGAVPSRARP